MKGLNWRIFTVIATVVFSLYLLIPSYLKFQNGTTVPRKTKAGDPWYYYVLPSETLKLGLDLSGGLHLVVGIDFEEVFKDATTKLKNQIKESAEEQKIANVTYEVTNDNKIAISYPDNETWKSVDKVIAKDFGQLIDFETQTQNRAVLRMSTLHEADVRRRAVDQSLETLRNRIDEFGIAEPIIQRQGDEKILIQFPGVTDASRLKEIISRTAKLSFQIVQSGPDIPGSNPAEPELRAWVDEYQKATNKKPDINTPMSVYVKELNTYLAKKLPAGTEILFHKEVNVNTKETEYIPYLLSREALVTGEDLQDAYYGFNPENNDPMVNFQLSPTGATKFEKATGENVGRYMAIVLDNNVHSAPRIKSKIGGGRAVIEMGGLGRSKEEVVNDAKDTSLVLRSGALPARILFLEERVIGPSLGADAIRQGTTSLAFGLLLVFIFMAIYYRASGAVAVFALFLNGIFIFAMLAAFEGTLSLPGLAGVTLTLGMAVDANVLIFEHMREELRAGKTVNLALGEGYHRAFSAIFDGHVTTIVSALVLLSFGYGPIRGFSVTLLMGLIASLYTSVFVTRVIFDFFVSRWNPKTISI